MRNETDEKLDIAVYLMKAEYPTYWVARNVATHFRSARLV